MKVKFHCPNGHVETMTGDDFDTIVAAYCAAYNVGIDIVNEPDWRVSSVNDLIRHRVTITAHP